jgi:hypothetical protein
VAAYVTEFSELVDQLNSYSQKNDPMYFTMRFIDGLKPEIKAIVLVQCPKSFDIACTLALLQKEVARPAGIKLTRGGDCYSAYKPAAGDQGPLQLLPLPPRPENPILAAPAPAAPAQSSADQKLAAIKTYRRALGLCFKYGAKWSKDHRYSLEVLQVVDAPWDSFSSEDSLADSSPDDSPPEHLMLVLSKTVMSGITAAHTVRLMGII